MGNQYNCWKKEEIEILKKEYPIKMAKEIGLILNRNINSIRGKLKSIRLPAKEKWDKGFTKYNNESIALRGKKGGTTKKRLYEEGKLIHPMLGKTHSRESREKMSESLKKGYKEGRLKPTIYWKGKKFSKEHRDKVVKGLWMYNLKQHPMLGRKQSKEARKKISEGNKGKVFSKERKIKIGNAHRGKTISQKMREQISNKLRGRKLPLEQRLKMGESRRGEKNPAWIDGRSFEPYTPSFNDRFKERIKERDNYTCQLCNIFEKDALKLYKIRLHIHHIDYCKENTFFQNCISLCIRCNSMVNKDREIWTKHFQDLLKKLYNYSFTEDQKIILDFSDKTINDF